MIITFDFVNKNSRLFRIAILEDLGYFKKKNGSDYNFFLISRNVQRKD